MQPIHLDIPNEHDPLHAVLVHRPGEEIDRLTHENMRQFLFEDIPYLTGMQDEHDEFVGEMRDRDIRVLYLEELLDDLLAIPTAKKTLIEQVCAAENVPSLAADLLDAGTLANNRLRPILFNGLTAGEHHELTATDAFRDRPRTSFILPPIPNAYFSRDPAVVIGRAVISCKMHYAERVRETVLTRAVLEMHPAFAGHRITYGGSDAPGEDRPHTIEGGDVIVLNEEAVLVGISERTRSETVERLARKAFEVGRLRRLYEIPIPTGRAFMHLDTVFTIVDRGLVVWYPQVMENVGYVHHDSPGPTGEVVKKTEDRSLRQVLSDEFGREVQIIRTGGGDDHYAAREQRTDGTNILAIAPRVACTYERNLRTIAAMEKAGIEVIRIVGAELVRGLGGPRCMTMPLSRAAWQEPSASA